MKRIVRMNNSNESTSILWHQDFSLLFYNYANYTIYTCAGPIRHAVDPRGPLSRA
ncbi:hypothetical protein BofuT4_P145410.1 [Botrytis cinerea T4]|uniref:Uncharacterized protein n=1 Tax=Botryotinia fuckeliana (strain T4) TaxID=999810 RepID=G2YYN5_BOTF4|nr:hypothetical protein BofuT4_P145410.1 [Botrytis cinerea T4]